LIELSKHDDFALDWQVVKQVSKECQAASVIRPADSRQPERCQSEHIARAFRQVQRTSTLPPAGSKEQASLATWPSLFRSVRISTRRTNHPLLAIDLDENPATPAGFAVWAARRRANLVLSDGRLWDAKRVSETPAPLGCEAGSPLGQLAVPGRGRLAARLCGLNWWMMSVAVAE